jgi:hypothetical protein
MVITDKFEIDGKEVTGHFSLEYLQDAEIQMRLLGKFRTTEITDEEIAIWKAISFGIDRTPSGELDQSPEAVTWRELLGCDGPGFRCPILTGEITQQEINEWGVEYEKLKKIDFEAVKKKYNVKFESDHEPPYPEYDTSTPGDCWPPFQPTAPIQWPAESTIFPWVEDTRPKANNILDSFLNFFSNPDTYGPRS